MTAVDTREIERFYYNNAGTFRLEQDGVIVETVHFDPPTGASVGLFGGRNRRWEDLNWTRRSYFEVVGTHPEFGYIYQRRNNALKRGVP